MIFKKLVMLQAVPPVLSDKMEDMRYVTLYNQSNTYNLSSVFSKENNKDQSLVHCLIPSKTLGKLEKSR